MQQTLRIVVADDERDIQDYFRRMLPRAGHSVVGMACNGSELVEQCRQLQPDLVITDIHMPGLDGLEAAAQIYQERPVPIILVSADHNAALIARAETGPIQAYLVKPIKQADLAPAIAVAVGRFRQVRQLQEALAQVKQLQGLLPICSYCKRIRDDHNVWQQLEKYVSARCDTHFSHGICPECFAQLVQPELEETAAAARS